MSKNFIFCDDQTMPKATRHKKKTQFQPCKVKVKFFGKLCITAELLDGIKKNRCNDTFYLDVNENNLIVGGGRTSRSFHNHTSYGKYPSSLLEGRCKTRYLTVKAFFGKMGSEISLNKQPGMQSYFSEHCLPSF